MNQFMLAPLSLVQGDLIVARVSVKNAIGWSTPSVDNSAGVRVQTIPHTPLPMTADLANTDTTQATVSMTALVDLVQTGGSPIVSYSLEWDQGTNGASFVALNGVDSNNIQLLYVAQDLTAGSTYKFRYRVRNIFGWSE